MSLSAEDHHLHDAVYRSRYTRGNRHDSSPAATAAVQQAIRDGANVNAVRNDFTPLTRACVNGNDRIIRMLLDAGADARWRRDRNGWSALTMAVFFAYSGHLAPVQLLINHDNGVLEMMDNKGRTPLFFAIHNTNYEMVQFFLDSGANANQADQAGVTALMLACQLRTSSLEVVRLLIDAGADVEARDYEKQQTPLIFAIGRQHPNPDMVQFLLDSGANLNHVDAEGVTALRHACHLGSLEIVRLLLAAGVDVEARDYSSGASLSVVYELVRANPDFMRFVPTNPVSAEPDLYKSPRRPTRSKVAVLKLGFCWWPRVLTWKPVMKSR